VEYEKINTERTKYNLEVLKFNSTYLAELIKVFKAVSGIVNEVEGSFNLTAGEELDSSHHETHISNYIIEKHKEILKSLRDVQAESLFLFDDFDTDFSNTISGITTVMNRINRDREKGMNVDEQDYAYLHNAQTSDIMRNLRLIISKTRAKLTELRAKSI
jgi:hypothetical protein